MARSPEEELARKLCMRSGNTEAGCDDLVFLTEPYRINTPKGVAYGCVVPNLRPLWTCWLEEALSIRHLAYDMASEMRAQDKR